MRTIEESLRQEFIDSQYFDTLDEAGIAIDILIFPGVLPAPEDFSNTFQAA